MIQFFYYKVYKKEDLHCTQKEYLLVSVQWRKGKDKYLI